MSTRMCPACGASYLEWVTTCSDCGVAVIDPDTIENPLALPEDDQLIYELGVWTLDQRTEVAEVMAGSGIPHAWDGEELYVHVAFEQQVDKLLEPIEANGPAVDDPLPHSEEEPTGDLTEYDLAEWSAAGRSAVATRLIEDGIAFTWEDDTVLLVAVDDEERVDTVFDELESSGVLEVADAASTTDDAETPAEVLERLFVAADKLRKGRQDEEASADLHDALTVCSPARPPYGVELAPWRSILAGAADLGELLPDEESDAEMDRAAVKEAATRLRDLLRPYV